MHGRVHGREFAFGQAGPDVGERGAEPAFRFQTLGDGEDDALVAVFAENRPCVDVVVQIPVVEGDEQRTRRQRCAVPQEGFRFVEADPAPAVLGHAPALRLEVLRADRGGSGKPADVMVHEYGKAVCAHESVLWFSTGPPSASGLAVLRPPANGDSVRPDVLKKAGEGESVFFSPVFHKKGGPSETGRPY